MSQSVSIIDSYIRIHEEPLQRKNYQIEQCSTLQISLRRGMDMGYRIVLMQRCNGIHTRIVLVFLEFWVRLQVAEMRNTRLEGHGDFAPIRGEWVLSTDTKSSASAVQETISLSHWGTDFQDGKK